MSIDSMTRTFQNITRTLINSVIQPLYICPLISVQYRTSISTFLVVKTTLTKSAPQMPNTSNRLIIILLREGKEINRRILRVKLN